jgi:EmrB/QacA subfamily drug resistance transporter
MQAHAQVTRQQGLSYKWIVAIIMIFGTFMSILDTTVVNIAIPRLQTAFGADIHSVQWVITAYLLVLGAMTPTMPYVANALGFKRTYMTALAMFTAGSLLCGLSWSLPVLIFFRILQGLGGSLLFPLSMTLLFREFPPEERGVAMATLGVPALMAPALGPILGGYLVTFADWQVIFFINVPIGIVALILAWIYLREFRAEGHGRFDLPGFLTSAYGLAAVLYALSDASTDGWGSTTVLAFLFTGVLALIIFVAIEVVTANRGGSPLLDVRLFSNRSFAASNLATIFMVFSMYGGLFFLPLYLESLRGLSAFQAGLLLLPQAIAAMVSITIGGRLVDKIGAVPVIIPGLILLIVANILLTHITLDTPYFGFDLILILRGFSNGLIGQPLMVAAMMDMRRPQEIADSSTLMTVTRSVGGSLGLALLATIVQTQTQVHYVHLADRVTASSPLGQMIPQIEAMFVARGADLLEAKQAAIMMISQMLQARGYMLAINDAFYWIIALCVVALIATLFIPFRSHRAVPAAGRAPAADTAQEPAGEPMLIG